jgi:hypothetical protein
MVWVSDAGFVFQMGECLLKIIGGVKTAYCCSADSNALPTDQREIPSISRMTALPPVMALAPEPFENTPLRIINGTP